MKNKKLNIIDYVILVVLVAAMALVGFKLLKGGNGSEDGLEESTVSDNVPTQRLSFTVLCDDVDAELAREIQKELDGPDYEVEGKKISTGRIFNSNAILDGEVTDCTLRETDKEGLVQLLFTVEADATRSKASYALGWQEIRLGKEYNVKTIGFELIGTILTVEKLG